MSTLDLSRFAGQPIDFAEDAPQVTQQQLSDVTVKAQRTLDLIASIQEAEKILAGAKQELQVLQEKELPDAMTAAGMTEFTHISGKKIVIKDVVAGAPPKATFDQALSWLREHDHDGIIKRSISVSVNLPKGQDAIGDSLVKYLLRLKTLQRLGVTPKDEPTIHYQTFGSWAREVRVVHIEQHLPSGNLDQDCPFCDEDKLKLLGIYVGKKAEVKPIKN